MKIDKRQKLLMVVAGTVLALFAVDKLAVTPLTNLWKDRAKEIARLRAQVQEGGALVKREQTIRTRWSQMQTNMLPDNPSLAQEQVLKALVTWSQESGASINGTTPQWKSDTDAYKTLVCRVDASGTLWTLSRFLYDIEKGPMPLKVESVDLGSRDNDGQQLTLALQISGLALTRPTK
jgi:hypothetical protein